MVRSVTDLQRYFRRYLFGSVSTNTTTGMPELKELYRCHSITELKELATLGQDKLKLLRKKFDR